MTTTYYLPRPKVGELLRVKHPHPSGNGDATAVLNVVHVHEVDGIIAVHLEGIFHDGMIQKVLLVPSGLVYED